MVLLDQPLRLLGFDTPEARRVRAREAGLREKSSHGIRKVVGIMAAERGETAHEITEIPGHDILEEAERYTRQADAIRLGNAGFSKV